MSLKNLSHIISQISDNPEDTLNQIERLKGRLRKITDRLGKDKDEESQTFNAKIASFLDNAKPKIEELEPQVEYLRKRITELLSSFGGMKIAEVVQAWKELHQFQENFKKAIQDNKRRKQLEERRAKLAARKKTTKKGKTVIEPEEPGILDQLLSSIRQGDFKLSHKKEEEK